MTDEEILAVRNLERVFKGLTGRCTPDAVWLLDGYPELCSAIEAVIGHKSPVLPTAEEVIERWPILGTPPVVVHSHGQNWWDWPVYPDAINTPPPEKLKDVMGKGEPPPEPKILTTDAEHEARLEELRQTWDDENPVIG